MFYYNFLLLVLTVEQAHGSQTVLYASSGGYIRQGMSDELVCECPPSSCATSAPAEFYKQDKKISPSSDYQFPGDRKMIIFKFDYDKEGMYYCAIDNHTSPKIDLKVELPVSITWPSATDVYAKEGVSSGFEISLITPQRPIWVNFSRTQTDTIDLRCSELVHPSSDEQVVRCSISPASLDDEGYYQVAVGASWYKVKTEQLYLHVQASELKQSCTALTPTSINVLLSYVPKWNHQVVLKTLMNKTILASLRKTSFEVDGVRSCTNYEITVLPSSSSHKPSTCAVRTPCVSLVSAMNVMRYKNRIFQRCGEQYQELCIFTNRDFEQLEKIICNSTRNNEISENQIQMNIFTKIKLEENSSVAIADFCAETVTKCSYKTLNCEISADFYTFRPTSERPTKEVYTAVSSDIIIGSVVGCLVVLGVGLVIIAFVVKKRLCKCKKQKTDKKDFEMASPSAADSKPDLNSVTNETVSLPDKNEGISQMLLEIRDELAAKAQAEANSQRVEVTLNSFKHKIISTIRNRDDQLLQQCVSWFQSNIANLANLPNTSFATAEVSREKLVRSTGIAKKSRQSAARADADPDSSILANHPDKSNGTAAVFRVNSVRSGDIVEESLQTTAHLPSLLDLQQSLKSNDCRIETSKNDSENENLDIFSTLRVQRTKSILDKAIELKLGSEVISCKERETTSKIVSEKGAFLELPLFGIVAAIPPAAVPAGKPIEVRISLFLSNKAVKIDDRKCFVALLKLTPHGTIFRKFVKITCLLKHHWKVTDDGVVNQFSFFYNNGFEIGFHYSGYLNKSNWQILQYERTIALYKDKIEMECLSFSHHCILVETNAAEIAISFFMQDRTEYLETREWAVRIVTSCNCDENLKRINDDALDYGFAFAKKIKILCELEAENRLLKISLADRYLQKYSQTESLEFSHIELSSVVSSRNFVDVPKECAIIAKENLSTKQIAFRYTYYETPLSEKSLPTVRNSEVLVNIPMFRLSDSSTSSDSGFQTSGTLLERGYSEKRFAIASQVTDDSPSSKFNRTSFSYNSNSTGATDKSGKCIDYHRQCYRALAYERWPKGSTGKKAVDIYFTSPRQEYVEFVEGLNNDFSQLWNSDVIFYFPNIELEVKNICSGWEVENDNLKSINEEKLQQAKKRPKNFCSCSIFLMKIDEEADDNPWIEIGLKGRVDSFLHLQKFGLVRQQQKNYSDEELMPDRPKPKPKPEPKTGEVTKAQCYEVAMKISDSWEFVARKLGFEEPQIKTIQKEYSDREEQAVNMLVRWIEDKGRRATVSTLYKALTHARKRKYAEEIFPNYEAN